MIAIYVRQSVDKKDSLSIESQIDSCKAKVNNEEYKIYKDKGFSGKNTNRPAFINLMKDVKDGKIHKIIVYRLDRFSRSLADFSNIWRTLKNNDVQFESINERFETDTPMGQAMLSIIMVFAELERNTIAERIKDNYYSRAKTGRWLGGPAPLGFDVIRTIIDGKSTPVLQENDDSWIVKRIFEMYAEDETSLGQIAKSLTDEGIKCMKRKTWDNVAVSRILHNPVYAKCDEDVYIYYLSKGVTITNSPEDFIGEYGGILVGKRDRSQGKYTDISDYKLSIGLHNGIIESDVWLKCQRKLDQNKQLKNTGKGKYTWLSGLLKCKHCEYGIKITTSGSKKYMICSGKTNYHICDVSFSDVSIEEVEEKVAKVIEELMDTFDFQNVTAEVNHSNIQVLKNIDKINTQIENLIDAFANNPEIKKIAEKRVYKLVEEKKELERKLKVNDNNKNKYTYSKKKPDFEALSFENKKKIARELIKRVEIGKEDGEVSVDIFTTV